MESELVRKLRKATHVYDMMQSEPILRILRPGEKLKGRGFTWTILRKQRSTPDGP